MGVRDVVAGEMRARSAEVDWPVLVGGAVLAAAARLSMFAARTRR